MKVRVQNQRARLHQACAGRPCRVPFSFVGDVAVARSFCTQCPPVPLLKGAVAATVILLAQKSRLHDGALRAAAGILVPVHVHLIAGTLAAAVAGVARDVLVVLADLAHNVVEGVVDVYAGLGRCLDESASELAR